MYCESLENRMLFSAKIPHFIIGVWDQPESTMEVWANRGVNTVVYNPHQTDAETYTWDSVAASRGLSVIRQPSSDIGRDAKVKNLMAFSQPDEPDWKQISPQVLAENYRKDKHAAPKLPVFTNFAGAYVVNPYWQQHLDYGAMLEQSDWVGNDVYPVTGWNAPQWIDLATPVSGNDGNAVDGLGRITPGIVVTKLSEISHGKPQIACIETSYQDVSSPFAGNRGPTPDEFRGELWDAIIHGANGVIYFPQKVGATVFANDNTSPDVATEITKQDEIITKIQKDLVSRKSSSFSVNGTIEECKWKSHGKTTDIRLNMSHQAVWSEATGYMGAYEVDVTIDGKAV